MAYLIQADGGARGNPGPAGAGAVEQALIRTAQSVGFNKTTIANGAKSFYAEAQKVVAG